MLVYNKSKFNLGFLTKFTMVFVCFFVQIIKHQWMNKKYAQEQYLFQQDEKYDFHLIANRFLNDKK